MKPEMFSIHADVEARHWWFEARRRILFPLIRQVMAGQEGEIIVDVGCGTGGTVAALCREYDCVGIDDSKLAIETAEAAYPQATHPRGGFRLGRMPDDLRDLAPRTGLYLLMDVLEHVEDDRAFLADLIALARPGAHILITVPAGPQLWSRHDITAGHLRRYEHDTLTSLWRNQGVSPRLVTFFNSRLYPLIRLARYAGNRFGASCGREGSDFHVPPPPVNALLEGIFAGEGGRILSRLDQPETAAYEHGVSLLALIRCAELNRSP